MSLIVKIDSKTLPWSQNKRYKVGQSIEHANSNWVNLTGGNSEPGIGVDWKFVSGTESVDLSTVVPYTGATGDVDLGVFDLTASSLNSVITRADKLLVLGTGQGANIGIGNSVPTSDEIKFTPTYQGSNPPSPDELIWQSGSGWRFEGGLEVQSLNLTTLPIFADDTAAASLSQGDVYRTSTGELRIKL